jgi:2-amino-4-hydroxy-6-hydroxymethyldihydropteridine diphosphokinase
LGLGGNLGNPLTLFDKVVSHFNQHSMVTKIQESPRYQSNPIDSSGPNYINSVLEIYWLGDASELLLTCADLESQLGRIRTTPNAPRLIDLDILLVGGQQIHTANLIVPHPRMHLRRFVLEPLLQLNPNIQIPFKGYARDYLPATLDQHIEKI